MIRKVNGLGNWTGKTKKERRTGEKRIYFPFLYEELVHSYRIETLGITQKQLG